MTFHDYAVLAIENRLAKMLSLADSVRSAEDIEAVHDMRVASRRLRAALSVFASAFPQKEFSRFDKDVKMVTDGLARARDLDVMIDTIKTLAESVSAKERGELESLARRMERDRAKIQKEVILGLDLAERCDLTGRFKLLSSWLEAAAEEDEASEKDADKAGDQFVDSDGSIRAQFAIMIPARLSELVSWEPCLSDVRRVRDLHQMRIAAKRLRYTMELLAPFEPRAFEVTIARMKQVQEELGNIHDIDVLVPCLWNHLSRIVREHKEVSELDSCDFVNFNAIIGLMRICERKRIERDELFAQFRKTWRELRSSGYFDALWTAANRTHEKLETKSDSTQVREEADEKNSSIESSSTNRRASRSGSRARSGAAQGRVRHDRLAAVGERREANGSSGNHGDQSPADTGASKGGTASITHPES